MVGEDVSGSDGMFLSLSERSPHCLTCNRHEEAISSHSAVQSRSASPRQGSPSRRSQKPDEQEDVVMAHVATSHPDALQN